MGYLIEWKTKAGKRRYTAMYRDARGALRSAGTFDGKKVANKAWRKREDEIDAGRVGDPRRGRQPFERYVEDEWFPNHLLELTTRENYRGQLDRYILDWFSGMKMKEILPIHVREFVLDLQKRGVGPATIEKCKVVIDAIFTTALNDQITFLHPGKGVKTPPVARKPKRIITTAQFDDLYGALEHPVMRLLVETDIETGLRWGELTELRTKDIDFGTHVLTISRAVVELSPKTHPEGKRFFVKDYPKDKQWRQLRLPLHLVNKLKERIGELGLGPDDLLFELPQQPGAQRRRLPAELPDPDSLGLTEPNEKGRQYRHGTVSAYSVGKCRCQHCRNAIASYRADRRAAGKDTPRKPRVVDSDGHVGNDWFRQNIWDKALKKVAFGFRITPHSLRHAHASWLLAGGADLQVVKERLGHGSIRTTEGYLHTVAQADDAALQAMGNFRGRSGPIENKQTEPTGTDPIDQLGKLADLLERGVLTDAEYEQKKKELLKRI